MNYRGEKGYAILTPFYTHLDANGQEQAIIVNRGWVPSDFKDLGVHYKAASTGSITGVLYRGEAKTKYSTPNTPNTGDYHHVTPYDFSLVMQLKNQKEASEFILHMIDNDAEKRQVLPAIPSRDELTDWKISGERHRAYSTMWTSFAYLGILSNTFLWLCM